MCRARIIRGVRGCPFRVLATALERRRKQRYKKESFESGATSRKKFSTLQILAEAYNVETIAKKKKKVLREKFSNLSETRKRSKLSVTRSIQFSYGSSNGQRRRIPSVAKICRFSLNLRRKTGVLIRDLCVF